MSRKGILARALAATAVAGTAAALAAAPTAVGQQQSHAVAERQMVPVEADFHQDPTEAQAEPMVFAHRGASGYLPEQTLESIALALDQGADGVEIDLVATADGELIVRHESDLALTTDVADRPEFADRQTTKNVNGDEVTSWFADDFTLEEIKTLRATERYPELRPDSAAHDGRFEIITYDEALDFLEDERDSGRPITVSTEMKIESYYGEEGIDIAEPMAEIIAERGLDTAGSWVWVQSFDLDAVEKASKLLPNTMGVNVSGSADSELLDRIASFADTVSINKNLLIPRDDDGNLTEPSGLVEDARERGLEVHAWTFRNENSFLPADRRRGSDAAAHGDAPGELGAYFGAGADGVFTDHPDTAVAARSDFMATHSTR